jgi:hypothetical protein
MAKDLVAVENTGAADRKRALTAAQYGDLSDVPPELEWLANITNVKTRRAYKIDVSEFSTFAGLRGPAELRTVTRAHVIACGLSPSSLRRKLSALSSLFDYLCERNAVSGNPVDGVKRAMANGNEGSNQHAPSSSPCSRPWKAPKTIRLMTKIAAPTVQRSWFSLNGLFLHPPNSSALMTDRLLIR